MPNVPTHRLGRKLRGACAGIALALAALPICAQAAPAVPAAATATAVPGKPALMLGAFELSAVGYQSQEYFVSGTATSYRLPGPASEDGVWNPAAAATAPFTTRIVAVRPTDPAKFNGTVLVEWLNVTAGQDTGADWMVAHREMIRRGYAYVAVSAQKVGVEGGDVIMQSGGKPLKTLDPARYGALSHPGDAFSFDIFSQVGALVKGPQGSALLGGLKPARVLGIGESQSAAFLTTYVNAVDRLARVYDGFFVHSRFGSAAALDGVRMGAPSSVPAHIRFRPDLRVPVLTLITETDLLGARLSGYHGSRQPANGKLRVWEVTGTAHADNYLFGGAAIDSGLRTSAELARIYRPSTQSAAGSSSKPFNPGMPHHYVTQAALTGLDRWVRSGKAPVQTAPLTLGAGGKPGETPALAFDAAGLALGGVRTPWVDVPTVKLSGKGDPNSFIGMLAGSGEPFDKDKLSALYPGGKADYLRRFTKSLDAAIGKGHILAEDRQEILDIAGINFDAATQ